ncbi:hypothetical protein [Parasitella parasitica]|uniref:Uncharacterized protein n=1 Tax=Parasitella parasitica TaxID=35722 RepID=A0A0B7N8C1_9FUNG|nr:hypothetical protein [Parasitella parasitica]
MLCLTLSLPFHNHLDTNELVVNLITQVNQNTKNLADFQAQFAETNLRDNNQLLNMIKSNESLSQELINLNNSVGMEHQAIQELSAFMYHKNSVTDAIVMIMRDLEKIIIADKASLQKTNALQEEIYQEVINNTEQIQRLEKRHDIGRDIMNKNFLTLQTALGNHATLNEDFKEWAQSEIQDFSQENNSTTAQVCVLQKELRTLNQKMREMEAKMNSMKRCSCQGHNSKLKELEHKMESFRECECHGYNSHESRIEDLEQGIVNFRGDFAEHRRHFVQHERSLQQFEAYLNQHSKNFSSHQDDFAAYQTLFADHQTRLEKIEEEYAIQGIVTHEFHKKYVTHDDLEDVVSEVKTLLNKANLNVQEDSIDNI